MRNVVNILKPIKMLLMACLVMFMLSACNADETTDSGTSPVAETAESSTQLSNNFTSCWQSEVIDVLYDLMGTVALDVYRKMTTGSMAVMMVAFAIWLAYRLLKQLSSFKEENMGEVWTEIFRMLILCFACGLIVSQVDLLVWVLGSVIFPVYNAFLEFASEILSTTVEAKSSTVSVFGQEITVGAKNLACTVSQVEITKDMTGFPDSPKQMMDCMVCAINNSLSFGMTIAFDTMRGTKVIQWIIGLLLLLSFLFVRLAFVFYLIDTIFRFTIMVIMLPLMIMFYPFPKTRGILNSGVAKMLNSAAFMMFFATTIVVCIRAITTILKNMENVFNPVASSSSSTVDAVIDAVYVPKDFGVPIICLLMIVFLLFTSISISGKMCDTFVGGNSSSKFQKSAKAIIIGAITWCCLAGVKLLPPKAKKYLEDKINKYSDKAKEQTEDLG